MMNNSKTIRLTFMMFFQYLLFAVWWVPLAAYLTNMDVSSSQMALILSSMALGCLFSPLIGMIADKYFPSEKVLAFLNIVTAILLLGAGLVNSPNVLFILLLFAMICHMPTWGLTSAIAMTHAPSEIFARIRVFGSIGWVASGLCSLFTIKVLGIDFDGTNIPFFYGAGFAFVATLINFTLPKTPPPAKGEKGSVVDALGLNTLKLMKEKNFAVFIIISFLAMIPFTMYFSYCSQFLQAENFKYISITMNWGQVAEMIFVLSVPIMIRRFKISTTLIVGLIFLALRNFSFYTGIASEMSGLYFIGILVHGIIYGYFFLGGQTYIDQKVPANLRAQAQGFIFLVTFGLGMLVGNFFNAKILEAYGWSSAWLIAAIISLGLALAMILFFRSDIAMEKVKK
jgi:nucleoside transporter